MKTATMQSPPPSMTVTLAMVALVALPMLTITANASKVLQCPGGKTRHLSEEEVQVTNCAAGVCRLKRRTTVGIELRFTPDKNVPELTTRVHAEVLGLPLPFIGVDGTSACDKLFAADGTTPAACPLQAGTPYVYRNSFPVLEVYPKLQLVVHWALAARNTDIVCFELPAKIV